MRVLVDTTIWSIALRRKRDHLNHRERACFDEWLRLVQRGDAALIGPIRQEVLSGVKMPARFDELLARLSAMPDPGVEPPDYVEAARYFNVCRGRGIAATPHDLILCAVGARLKMPIFSADEDFPRLAVLLPVRLHDIPE